MHSLHNMNIFLHVAESLSFTQTGRQLGLSAAAVGKSISRLEAQLGVQLLYRSTRSMTLTEEGQYFLTRSRHILEEVTSLQRELTAHQHRPQGHLRLSLPNARALMLPILSDFTRLYPEITLELDFNDRVVDIIEERFDAVVRAACPTDSRLASRRLGTFHLSLVGAPDYFRHYGYPACIEALAQHRCLHYRYASAGRLELWPLNEVIPMSYLPVTMVCNSLDANLQFALDGHGIACLPDFAIHDALETGKLERVLPDQTGRSGTFHMLWPSNRYLTSRLRALIDHFSDRLSAPRIPA